MDCLFVERELKSANTQVLACSPGFDMRGFVAAPLLLLHVGFVLMQGVSGKVKERMEAAAKESDGGARLMLLFPEVEPLMAASLVQGVLPGNPDLKLALREPPQTGSICFHSRVEPFWLGHQCNRSLYNMARCAFVSFT